MTHTNRPTLRAYSRAEYLSDAVVHVSGLAAALIGGPVLIAMAAIWLGEAGITTAMIIYVVSMVLMLGCSAMYNMLQVPAWGDRLRRIDQSAIYVKIAGTYTPFVALTAAHAGWFLAAIWAVAATGAALILLARGRMRLVSLTLYLGLGWAGAVWGGPLVFGLTPPGLTLLATGGILYTAGIAFLLWDRLPFHNTIWHIFVLAATVVCYAAIMVELWVRIGV